MELNFHPFSLGSWRVLFRNSGSLGYAAVMIVLSGKMFDLRSSADVVSGSLSGSMFFRALLIGGAVVVLIGHFKYLRTPKGFGMRMGISYVLVSMVSVLWSFVPIASFGKSLELLVGMLVVMVALGSKYKERKLIAIFNLVVYTIFFQLLIVLVGYLVGAESFSQYGSGGLAEVIGNRALSPFMSANTVGYMSALLATILLNMFAFGRHSFLSLLPYFLVIISTLICSTSRTALAMFLCTVLILLYYRNKSLFIIILAPLLIWSAYILGGVIITFLQGNAVDGVFYSLSGRTILWEYAWGLILDHPWIGLGFGVGSRAMFFLTQLSGFGDTISTAHNGFLEVLSGVGVLGFLPWVMALIYMLALCVKEFPRHGFRYASILCVWPILIGTTIMSVGVGGAFSEMVMIFFLLLAFFSIKPSKPVNSSQKVDNARVEKGW